MVMKSKVKSSSSKPFVSGGGGKMFGKQAAGPMSSGVTAGKSGAGGKFPAGGKGKMFGKQTASKMPSGQTGK